jgi:hypothetical protein
MKHFLLIEYLPQGGRAVWIVKAKSLSAAKRRVKSKLYGSWSVAKEITEEVTSA